MNKVMMIAAALVAGLDARLMKRSGNAIVVANGTENSSGFKTFQATAAAIPQGARVKIDSNGLISVAAAVTTSASSAAATWPG